MIKANKSKGGLYELARNAKERLKSNNYTKSSCNVISINTAISIKSYPDRPKQKIENSTLENFNSYDEILYKKVCEIIENKLDNLNPINELIDRKIFATLEPNQKQHYINTLIEKYKQLRQRYFKEHYSYQVNY